VSALLRPDGSCARRAHDRVVIAMELISKTTGFLVRRSCDDLRPSFHADHDDRGDVRWRWCRQRGSEVEVGAELRRPHYCCARRFGREREIVDCSTITVADFDTACCASLK
jgi:hypothetical protein